MRTKPAPAPPRKPAPKAVTLTLDMMDEPPVPTKPTRRASGRQASAVPAKPVPTANASAKLSPTQANAPAPLPPAKAPVLSAPAPRVPAPKIAADLPAMKPAAKTTARDAAPKAKGNTPAASLAASPPARRVPVIQASPDIPAAKPKAPRTVPDAKAKLSAAKTEAATLEREMALEGGGRIWRMSGRHAVAYVQNSALACALLAVETRHLSRHAMAIYYDKKGRAIAWQVRFDTQHWEEVLRQLG